MVLLAWLLVKTLVNLVMLEAKKLLLLYCDYSNSLLIHKPANFNFHLHLHLQSRLCNPEKYNFNHALFPFHRLIVIIQLEKLEAKATCAPLHQSRPEHTDQCSFGGKSAMQSNAIQYKTTQSNRIQCNTMQCNVP